MLPFIPVPINNNLIPSSALDEVGLWIKVYPFCVAFLRSASKVLSVFRKRVWILDIYKIIAIIPTKGDFSEHSFSVLQFRSVKCVQFALFKENSLKSIFFYVLEKAQKEVAQGDTRCHSNWLYPYLSYFWKTFAVPHHTFDVTHCQTI